MTSFAILLIEGDGRMSFASDFGSAIEYIEENLTGDIDFNVAAKKVKCSTNHFKGCRL